MSNEWPERIWLLPGTGDEGSATWCDDPNPGVGMEATDAIEYVRADAVPRWQDISTAPRDGSFFVAYKSGWCWPMVMCWIAHKGGGLFHSQSGFSTSSRTDIGHPTHWMPLPPPPKNGE